MRKLTLALGLAILFSASAIAQADSQCSADLTGAQEVPPNATTATGNALVKLDKDGTTISVLVNYTGLGSNITAAHIHTGAVGTSGPPIVDLKPTPGATSGSIENFAATLSDVQAADLVAGRLYVNVHSTGYPDGEIRGQLVAHPDNAVNADEESDQAYEAEEEVEEEVEED